MAYKLNITGITKTLDKAVIQASGSRKVTSLVKAKAEKVGARVAKDLEEEFDSHTVTKELSEGPQADHHFFSRGNIASFFGLNETKIGEDLEIMRGLLTVYKTNVKREGNKFTIKLIFTPLETFYQAIKSPTPQSYGISWLKAMEEGLLQNFDRFFFKRQGLTHSRSGTGIQTKGVIKGSVSSVPKIPYIKEIYQKVLKDVGRAKAYLSQSIRGK